MMLMLYFILFYFLDQHFIRNIYCLGWCTIYIGKSRDCIRKKERTIKLRIPNYYCYYYCFIRSLLFTFENAFITNENHHKILFILKFKINKNVNEWNNVNNELISNNLNKLLLDQKTIYYYYYYFLSLHLSSFFFRLLLNSYLYNIENFQDD